MLTKVCLSILCLAGSLHVVGCGHHYDVKDKVIIITGASSGFGKGVAQQLAGEGAHVVLAARRTALIEGLAQQVGNDALAVTTDVGNVEDMQRLAQATLSKFGRIDVWINNAGVGAFGRFEDIPVQDHARLVQTNLLGVLYGSHLAMKQFRQQGFGRLINIASISGKIGTPYYASYSATKFGINGLGEALNQELRLSKSDTIHVSTVNPPAADTPFWEHAANYTGHTPRATPMYDPSDVVNAIVDTVRNPQQEVNVGFGAKSSAFFHRMAPDTAAGLFGRSIHTVQMENAPLRSKTPDSLYEPGMSGTEVSGGVRERIAEEDRVRR